MSINSFKFNPLIREELELVLKRENVSYSFDENLNKVSVDISGNAFHILVEDAYCEQASQVFPVISWRTLKNPVKMAKLLGDAMFYHVRLADGTII